MPRVLLLAFVIATNSCRGQAQTLSASLLAFRDDSTFYQYVRAAHRPDLPKPTLESVDSLTATFDLAYREYVRGLLLGFVQELASNLPAAEQAYRQTLEIAVYEGDNYYARIDLARVALKRGDLQAARDHLAEYLRQLSIEIRLGLNESVPVDSIPSTGSVPGPELAVAMERDRVRLTPVMAELLAITRQRR
jgi:hypothetical protein